MDLKITSEVVIIVRTTFTPLVPKGVQFVTFLVIAHVELGANWPKEKVMKGLYVSNALLFVSTALSNFHFGNAGGNYIF